MRTHSKDASARVLRLTYSALYLAIALVLPFLTGQIPQIGSMLCPMHIPALLCGFVCGWPWGLAVGFIAPLLRSAPAASAAGAGRLARVRPHLPRCSTGALIAAMVAGRLVWGAARYLLAGLEHSAFTPALFLAGAVTTALPGILLHIVLIPVLVMAMQKARLILN